MVFDWNYSTRRPCLRLNKNQDGRKAKKLKNSFQPTFWKKSFSWSRLCRLPPWRPAWTCQCPSPWCPRLATWLESQCKGDVGFWYSDTIRSCKCSPFLICILFVFVFCLYFYFVCIFLCLAFLTWWVSRYQL